jgi:hypothetical protein
VSGPNGTISFDTLPGSEESSMRRFLTGLLAVLLVLGLVGMADAKGKSGGKGHGHSGKNHKGKQNKGKHNKHVGKGKPGKNNKHLAKAKHGKGDHRRHGGVDGDWDTDDGDYADDADVDGADADEIDAEGIDGYITITPSGTNVAGFTATVYVNDGDGTAFHLAPDGTAVTVTLTARNGATISPVSPRPTSGTATADTYNLTTRGGKASVAFTLPTAGVVTGSASTTLSVAGSGSITRTTGDGQSQDGPVATVRQ